jgi:branched-chain amino acid transport system substrate-binding protein
MNRKPLDIRDRLFIGAVVIQLVVAAVLGVAIVRAIDRSGGPGRVEVIGASPTPSALASQGATPGAQTRTSVTGGSAGGSSQAGSTGVSSGSIKLGGVFTLSGPGDATVALHAVQAYFNTVNADGGVHGRRLQYVTRDDHFDPSIGYSEVKDLVENQKIFAGVSWVAPNTENDQTIGYLERVGVPLVGNFGQPPEYTSPISYSFTLDWTVSPRLTVRTMANTLGQKKIALIWIHLTNEIDQIVRSSATDEAKKWGAEIVYMEAADVAKGVYDDTVVTARNSGATGVVTIMDAFSYSRYWQSFSRSTWRPTQVGYPFVMDPQSTNAIPSGYTNVYGLQEMELPGAGTPPVREYLAAMRKYYPGDMDELSWASELSWLGAKMFVEALKRAGPQPTRKGVMNALDTMTNFNSGFAPPYTIRPGPHDFVRCAKGAKLSGSRTWVQFSDWFCM